MGSLILFIAVVLIFKTLFSSFGITSSNDKKNEEEKAVDEFLKQNFKKVKSGQVTKNVFVIDLTKDGIKENNNVRTVENILKQQATAYNEDMFLKQVERVVEVVVDGFAKGDKNILKELLTEKLFNIFSEEIDKNLGSNLLLRSVIVSFDEKKLLNSFDYNSNTLSVSLSMKQINYIEDCNNNVIHGDKNNSVVIKEIWTFVKNNNPVIQSPWLVDSITEYKE